MTIHPYVTHAEGQRRRYEHGKDGIISRPWRPAIKTAPDRVIFPRVRRSFTDTLAASLVPTVAAICALYFIWQFVHPLVIQA